MEESETERGKDRLMYLYTLRSPTCTCKGIDRGRQNHSMVITSLLLLHIHSFSSKIQNQKSTLLLRVVYHQFPCDAYGLKTISLGRLGGLSPWDGHFLSAHIPYVHGNAHSSDLNCDF